MGKCNADSCQEIIEYLPFRCKYCGGTFCKKHRLPENHQCSFRMIQASSPASPPAEGLGNLYRDQPRAEDTYRGQPDIPPQAGEGSNFYQEDPLEREMRDYVRRQEREARSRANIPRRDDSMRNEPPRRGIRMNPSFFSPSNEPTVTYWLMGLNVLFFILGLIIPGLVLLSKNNVMYMAPLITAMFVPGVGFMGFISLIFTLLILWSLGRQVEMKYGKKFLLTLYITGGLVSGFAVIIAQLCYMAMGVPEGFFIPVATQNGALLCIITFFIYIIGLEREMQFIIYFIPVRLKAKYILIFLLIVNIIFAALGSLESYGSLAGMLAGKLFFGAYNQRDMRDYY